MPHSRTFNIAGAAALVAMLSAAVGETPHAVAAEYRKAQGGDASYRYDRRPALDRRRDASRRYDPNNLPSGTVPSDINLDAPGGPESLFEIIRRNSR
ncbi:MAG: hypothetical protein ACK4MF_08285 [Hyphomicrobiaceae bacterium]